MSARDRSVGLRPELTGPGQSGSSLVEVAIAVMLIGISLLSLLTLLYGVMTSSASHRATVRTGNRASEIAEQVDDLIYIGCPAAGDQSGALYRSVLNVDSGRLYDESIVTVQFLQNRAATSSTWGACPSTDQGAQRITIRVTTRSKPIVSRQLVMVKRDTLCPGGIVEGKC